MKPCAAGAVVVAFSLLGWAVAPAQDSTTPPGATDSTQVGREAAPDSTRASTGSESPRSPLVDQHARTMVDTLLGQVAELRGLTPKRELTIHVASRDWVRARLEEIIVQEHVEPEARKEERILKFLGLVPEDVDLLELYKNLVEEQLAGMYDIDRRVLVLADWLPPDLQALVVTHELVHALQDQHFSLRVRKKLGFETPDAEAAWHALIEGDATASMLELAFRGFGRSFVAVVESLQTLDWTTILRTARGLETQHLLAAPNVVRDALNFPYEHGLGFVTALFREGGWRRVDEAYLRPPVTTEQILHPVRFLDVRDGPIRVETPDVRGLLGAGFEPVANLPLGEFDLYLYLKEYLDPEIAAAATEGWGGATLTLYEAPDDAPDGLVLVTTWDSDEDALEFFGAVIGALDARYPEQRGDLEATSEGRIVWNVDPEGRYQNIVRLVTKHVQVLEQVPVSVTERMIQKLDRMTRYEDPTPEVRALTKAYLPWNRVQEQASADSALTLVVKLPSGWEDEPLPEGRDDLLLQARRAGARLNVIIDHDGRDQLGVSGYAHALAARIHQKGNGVYIQKDVAFPHDHLKLHEHVFTQTEDTGRVVYYIAVANLRRGFGYVLISQPEDDATPNVEADFYQILRTLQGVPWTPPADGASSGDPGSATPPRSRMERG